MVAPASGFGGPASSTNAGQGSGTIPGDPPSAPANVGEEKGGLGNGEAGGKRKGSDDKGNDEL